MFKKYKFFPLKFDFQFILIFFSFYTYGFYGIISKEYNFIFTILAVSLLIFFYIYYKNNNSTILINLNKNDLIYFLLFFTFFSILNTNDLRNSLVGDEYADALRTIRTAVYVPFIIIDKFNLYFLKDFQFSKIVYFVSFFQLFFFITLLVLFYKKRNKFLLFLLIFITITFRIFLKDYGMHPPINHFFSLIFLSFFGISEFVVKLSYIFLFSLGGFIFFKQLNEVSNSFFSLVTTIFIFTIPLAFFSSTTDEIWHFCFLINFFFYIFLKKKINYEFLILIISILSLARILIFFSIIPLLILYLYEKLIIERNKINKKFIFDFIKILLPVLIFLPFVLMIFLIGHPHYISGTEEISRIVENILFSFENKVIFHSIIYFIPSYLFPFIIFFLIPFKKNEIIKIISLIIFFVILIFAQSTIGKGYSGLPKYIFEYVLPFWAIGFFKIFFLINEKIKKNNIFNFFIIFLCLINLNSISNYPFFYNNLYTKIFDEKKFQESNYIDKNYNYKQAFDYLKKNNLTKDVVFVGVYYGFVPEIFNGYTFNELKIVRENYEIIKKVSQKENKSIVKVINEQKKINFILLSNIADKENHLAYLLNFQWKIRKIFKNEKHNTKVYLLQR